MIASQNSSEISTSVDRLSGLASSQSQNSSEISTSVDALRLPFGSIQLELLRNFYFGRYKDVSGLLASSQNSSEISTSVDSDSLCVLFASARTPQKFLLRQMIKIAKEVYLELELLRNFYFGRSAQRQPRTSFQLELLRTFYFGRFVYDTCQNQSQNSSEISTSVDHLRPSPFQGVARTPQKFLLRQIYSCRRLPYISQNSSEISTSVDTKGDRILVSARTPQKFLLRQIETFAPLPLAKLELLRNFYFGRSVKRIGC